MALLVQVVADAEDSDAGFVGERLTRAHQADLVFLDRGGLPASLGPAAAPEADLLLLLGSARSVWDPAQADVVLAEAALVRSALASDVPVLGICYGAQLLAHALGGAVAEAPRPEIGWFELTSLDPVLCPPGPWTQFHSDAFAVPPGSRLLGTSPSGSQGFAHEPPGGPRALGWQFHPEVTADRFCQWVDRLREYCLRHGADPEQLRSAAAHHEPRLRGAAHALVDSAVAWLREPLDTRPPRAARSTRPALEVHP
jgi:GMP synthase-like glutamine amidotransferase